MPLCEIDTNITPVPETSVDPAAEKARARSRSPARRMSGGCRSVLRCVRLSAEAILPRRGSRHAAGHDLFSAHDCVVPARGKALVKTDIQVELPDGCYGRVAPRSGLAWKQHIDIGAGVIDRDYRGNVGVVMFNHGDQDLQVKHGDRIAQLILERIFYPEIVEADKLEETDRGEGGFGSSGTR